MELIAKQRELAAWSNVGSLCRQSLITAESVVPDTLPDVGRIVWVQGGLLLKGKELSPGGVGVNGEAWASVLYLTEEQGSLESLRLTKPFRLDFEGLSAQPEALPGLTCLDGCIYIWARREAPGIIAQSGKILRVFFGFRRGQDDRLRAKAAETERILRAADIHAHFTDTIERDALQKFAFVSPMGAAGLYCDAVSGDMQPGGRARDTFIALIEEVKALGAAMGLTFEKDLVQEGLRIMDASAPTLTTSMQRDVEDGGPSEFAGLVSRIVTLGQKYHVPVPLYTKIDAWGKEHGLA